MKEIKIEIGQEIVRGKRIKIIVVIIELHNFKVIESENIICNDLLHP